MIQRIRRPDGTNGDIDHGPGVVTFRTVNEALAAMGGLHALVPGDHVPARVDNWKELHTYTAGWFATKRKALRVKP